MAHPAAYEYALRHAWAHDLEQASFLLGGLLAWSQLIDPGRQHALSVAQRAGDALGLFAAGHVMLHPPFFEAGPLYDAYKDQGERLLGLSPLADQHLAAIVMTPDQVLLLGMFLVLLLRRAPAPRHVTLTPRPARRAQVP